MQFQRCLTPIVPAHGASTTHVIDGQLAYLLSPPLDASDQILASIGIGPFLGHRYARPSQPPALPTELPGSDSLVLQSMKGCKGTLSTILSPHYKRPLVFQQDKNSLFRPDHCSASMTSHWCHLAIVGSSENATVYIFGGLQLAPAFERFEEGHLVGVLQVAPDRKPVRQPCHPRP